MIRSLVLFVHITGVLTMFAGLALEAFSGEAAGKPTPRIFGIGAPLAVLSGFYLGARVGVLGNDAKPDAVASLIVLGLALGVSTFVALPIGFKQASGLSSTRA